MTSKFPRLSSPHSDIEPIYDVIVIGSGYGASIAASRCARAGQRVCVLERGKEWLPGEFPESLIDTREHFQITHQGKADVIGDPTDLYEAVVSEDITVIQGCGLGGGSLINASVGLDADPRVFEDDKKWPAEIRDDMKTIMDVDRKHVHEMLRPNVYPDHYPTSAKHEAMKKAAKGLGIVDVEDIGKIFRKTPLFVNFDKEKSKDTYHRYDQPACNACGNCCTGCNTGAKNTLNMTYLPDAKAHGARIFTEVSVVSVQRDPYASIWMVFYKRHVEAKGIKFEDQIVRAKYVILGAGALGSTKILLKSKERGLEISDKIGHNFTGNGDALGFSYHGKDVVNSVGLETGMYEEIPENAPGPTITSVIDLRALPGMNYKEGMVIEEGTAPGALEMPLKVVMAFASKTLGVKKFPSQKKMRRFFEKLSGTDIEKTLAFLCMSHDDSAGVIKLDEKSNGIMINWEDVGKQKIFESISSRLQQISQELGGTYIINPTWSDALDNQLVTVHPLGGCPMADDGEDGVVNHKGQVFINDTEDVYPGLYVMDGAILPTSVGVNPVMTISVIAERCMRLLIKDAGWNIDYDAHRAFHDAAIFKAVPGIRFSERMSGQLTLKQSEELTNCEFTVTIECQDVEDMLEIDPNHEAEAAGTLTCPGLSEDPLTISSGKFRFFSKSLTIVDAKEMIYTFILASSDNKKYYFRGKKVIKADKAGEIGLTDTTTLFVDVREGEEDSGKLVASGLLKISFEDFYNQLHSIEVINTDSEMEQIKWKTKFGSFFAKSMWHTYSGMAECKYLDPKAPPRLKRPLKTNGVVPVVHKIITKDNVELRVTRYKGGGKGPLIVCHGMGTNTILFTLDTIPTNFLEYFLEHGYDVWLFDTRLSTACPWISALHNYAIDDMIEFDFPAVVDTVLEITGEKDVQILAHCVSSMALWGSVISGRLKGKLRTAIFSQAVPIPEGSFMNRLKSKLHLSTFLDNMGIKTVTAYTDKHDKSAWMNCFARTTTNAMICKDEQCSSDVCHRISFFYGLIYEHANFNVETHDILHEIFGTASAGYFHQLSKMFRANKMVDKAGNDIYIPGMDKDGVCTHTDKELEWISNLDFPIYLFCGSENESFKLSSVEKMYKALGSFHPKQDYEFQAVPGYGHVDHFIGKNACYDVWPGILRFLDKYAENNAVKSRKFLHEMKKAVKAVKVVQKKSQDTTRANVTLADLLPEKEIKTIAMPNGISDDSSDDDDDDDDDVDIDELLEDANEDQVAALRNKIDDSLKDEIAIRWSRKKVVKSSMHKPPGYYPPEHSPNAVEKIFVEKVLMTDESLKREIYVLSDVHLGGEWSKENVPKVKEFLFSLAKIAELYVHTIVLLGDIFEMWMTPITMSPPSLEEMVKSWKNDENLSLIMRAIKKMAEDDNVRVYYIRGNHDHEIDEKSVKELFGEKVRFIPGKLIYLINTGSQEYRIRFEHGHDYDLFNCFDLAPVESPMRGKPMGYYVSRCAQSSKENYFSDTEMVIQDGIRWLLSVLPNKVFGSTIADILSKGFFQKRLLNTMFENALDLDITEAACILLEDGNWVRIKELMKYPFIKLAINKYGSSRVFSMLEGSLGNFGDFLGEMSEDVIVLGHTHIFKNARFSGRLNKMYYVNSGTWIDLSEQFSYVKITPPKKNEDGIIQLEFNSNKTTEEQNTKC